MMKSAMVKESIAALLFAAGMVCHAAESPDLLRNGSFEEGLDEKGVPKYWKVEYLRGVEGKAELVPDHATHGKNALHLVKSNAQGAIILTQHVFLKPNTDYILELKGFRKAATRWHYYGYRMPGCKVRGEGRIPVKGGVCPALRFTSDSRRTRCEINISLWGYNDNRQATIGELWVDEVSLRELPRTAGRIEGIGQNAFADDTLRGSIFSADFKGPAVITLSDADRRVVATRNIELVPGNNSFAVSYRNASPGMAILAVKGGGTLELSHKLMIQKGF